MTAQTGPLPAPGPAPGPAPALVAAVVHDLDPGLAEAEMGTVVGWAGRAGITLDVVTAAEPMPDPRGLDGIVVFGSEQAAYDDAVPWLASELDLLAGAIEAGTPVLGICFGGQLLARALGGTVRRAYRGEFGWTRVTSDDETLVPSATWMEFHFDTFSVPPGAVELARTPVAPQAFVHGPHLGLQFHPELTPEAFETWARAWKARGFDRTLPELGLDLDELRADVAAQADASREASWRLFENFWRRASRLSGRT
jgi:GMP synthase-like glutamine amidotransferase